MAPKKTHPIDEKMTTEAEEQIKSQQREIRYDLRDFTIDYIVQQFKEGLFFIPDYQRKFIWRDQHQINFIESIILGLPIPMIFVADLDDGRLEIVDGAQRIQTLERFSNNDLKLKNLQILTKLDGFSYTDLPSSQQRKFDTKALRLVVLEDSTSVERRQEIFNRINTGSVRAKASEIRRGNFESPLMKFVIKCSQDKLFQELCPVSQGLVDRREREELILRFFAYSENYKNFKHDVGKFLDSYLLENEETFDRERLQSEFNKTMLFVKQHFPNGFAKTKNAKSTPRVRFEALSVGVNLALRKNPDAIPSDTKWIESEEFKHHTTTHASNSAPKLRGRVEYVRDQIIR